MITDGDASFKEKEEEGYLYSGYHPLQGSLFTHAPIGPNQLVMRPKGRATSYDCLLTSRVNLKAHELQGGKHVSDAVKTVRDPIAVNVRTPSSSSEWGGGGSVCGVSWRLSRLAFLSINLTTVKTFS